MAGVLGPEDGPGFKPSPSFKRRDISHLGRPTLTQTQRRCQSCLGGNPRRHNLLEQQCAGKQTALICPVCDRATTTD